MLFPYNSGHGLFIGQRCWLGNGGDYAATDHTDRFFAFRVCVGFGRVNQANTFLEVFASSLSRAEKKDGISDDDSNP